jgi:hypothetical protein
MNFGAKVENILSNAEKYHRSYYEAETFRGPSLYFHLRALATRHSPNDVAHLEFIYATLASWGMHRMGKGGSKMQPFEVFRQSMELLLDKIIAAQQFDHREMDETKWAFIRDIFYGIRIMASNTSLVGNSKVMHHVLPNMVPPVDREYTLRYLYGNTTIKNNLELEWLTLKEIISDFFIPVASNAGFQVKATKWMSTEARYPWDTSVLKVVDNLLIGSMKGLPEL